MRQFTLGPAAHAAGYQLFGFETVGSTNKLALDHIEAGHQDRVWFASLEQTAGRGRRGRAWASNKGNLAASLSLCVDVSKTNAGNLGFVAGVAMHEALSKLVGDAQNQLTLKWPNDVLLNRQKLVGILIEAQAMPNGLTALAVGMGVNVKIAPEGLPYKVTSLSELGVDIDAVDVFAALSDSFSTWFDRWQWGRDNNALFAYWRDHAQGLGERIIVRQPAQTFEGVFERLDDDGHLVVRMDDNSFRVVTAADIFFAS